MGNRNCRTLHVIAALAVVGRLAGALGAQDRPNVSLTQAPGEVRLAVEGESVAAYYYNDPDIPRPYFAHVRAPGGLQVTRNHPPIAGADRDDHPTFHPGIWMTFGDINGSDYWRLKAPTRHAEFIGSPSGGNGQGSFTVRNHYLSQSDSEQVVCEEICQLGFYVRPAGYLLTWDSIFSSDQEFYFGDQEEMGLGFRVATPLRVESSARGGISPGTGTILDSAGRRNGEEVWGNAANWCDYSGTIQNTPAGITVFCHPENFRPSWYHARDYGFLTANPFGRAAMKQGQLSRVVVKPGEKLRLRYGILLHSGSLNLPDDLDEAYTDYVQNTGD